LIQPDARHDRRSQILGDRLRTLLGKPVLRCEREDIHAMRRNLASKLLHLGVDTGVRQRVLGHFEGTMVDHHHSDDGLRELKTLPDQVDCHVEVGQVPGIASPVITGCGVHLLPPIEVLVAMNDHGDLSALRLADPDTGDCVFAARIAGSSAPTADEWQDLEVLSAKVAAGRMALFRNST